MFDASKIYDTVPDSARVVVNRRLSTMLNPLSLPLHKKLLKQELYEAEYRCNVAAWGHHASNLPAPTPEQGAELLKRLSSPSFIQAAVDAASLRYMLAELERLDKDDRAKHEKQWAQANAADAEKKEREAFDAFEAAEREKRFQDWRKQSCRR